MYRKGVSALIFNKNKELLLVNLVSFEERFFAIPGGGLEDGEDLKEAVYREIQEELGIEKEPLEYVGESDEPLRFKFKEIKFTRDGKDYEGSERYFFGFNFLGDDMDIKFNDGEVRSYKWVKLQDLKNYLLFESQLEETTKYIREIFPISNM